MISKTNPISELLPHQTSWTTLREHHNNSEKVHRINKFERVEMIFTIQYLASYCPTPYTNYLTNRLKICTTHFSPNDVHEKKKITALLEILTSK
jgi:hypothetical protein